MAELSERVAGFAASFQERSLRTQILTVGTLVLALSTVISYVRSWYRLRHVPGPFLHSWTSLVQVKKMLDGKSHIYFDDLTKKYGPLVRVGPNEVMFTDPETLRKCSAVNSPYVKGHWYEGTRATKGKDHVFSLTDDGAHRELRKKLSPGYSGVENGGFEPAVDRNIAKFIDLIERKYVSSPTDLRPMELGHRAQFFTLDIISDVAYSQPFGFMEKDEDLFNYVRLTELSMPVFTGILVIPGLYKWLQAWPLNVLMPTSNDKFGIGCMMGFAEKTVDDRLAPGGKPQRDVLQSFIKHGLPRDQIVQEILIQILGGSDTTATAIRMTLLLLINNPPALRRLLAEIDAAVAAARISSPIKNAEAIALPYLQGVIREGLRLYPPGAAPVYKQVPEGGDVLHGYFLPGGTQVGQNLWGLLRSRDVFGDDADDFRPERWMVKDGARLRAMVDAQELVFGYGKNICLGKQMALMELNKIFVELLRRYDFSVMNPTQPLKLRFAGLWLTNDYWLKITRRD